MRGYNEMLRRIEPSQIICYHYPFPEMRGNIVFVDYDLSSWKHDNDDLDKSVLYTQSERYALGIDVPPPHSKVIIKHSGLLLNRKGMGSIHGGEWRPHPDKPQDKRLIGEPGEKKTTIMPNGDKYETKIGDNGFATRERHYTDHGRADKHSDPHDHDISWGRRGPDFGSKENYWEGNAPEFKKKRGC